MDVTKFNFFLEKQIAGSSVGACPVFRCSPEEKSGAAASPGFI